MFPVQWRLQLYACQMMPERRNYKGVVDAGTRIVKEEVAVAFWRKSTAFVQRAMIVGVFQVATLHQFKGLYSYYLNQKKNQFRMYSVPQ